MPAARIGRTCKCWLCRTQTALAPALARRLLHAAQCGNGYQGVTPSHIRVRSTLYFSCALQGAELPRKLQALKGALREEIASAENVSREYLRELLALVEQTQAQLHARLGELQQQQPDQAEQPPEPDLATKAEL